MQRTKGKGKCRTCLGNLKVKTVRGQNTGIKGNEEREVQGERQHQVMEDIVCHDAKEFELKAKVVGATEDF